MPDPISWYALGRVINDPQTIMEAIDEKFLAHNQDLGAHGFSNEAVWAHRNQYLLDHVNYSIYNVKINPASRPVKAFVDVGGAAEYSNIQEAIDYVNSLGGGRIVIKSGIYNLMVNPTLYSNITLEGENASSTIIRFSGAGVYPGKGIKAIGDSSPYSTGTVSIPINSKIVTGIGTLWLANVSAGDYISLDNVWYEIESVDTNTQLTLSNIFLSTALSGVVYEVATFKKDIVIQDLTIEGVDGKIFNEMKYITRGTFRNINGGKNYATDIMITKCSDSKIEDCDLIQESMGSSSNCHIFQNNANYPLGVIIDGCRDSTLSLNVVTASDNRGIVIRECKRFVVFASFTSSYNWESIQVLNSSQITVIYNTLISQGPSNAKTVVFDNTHYSILSGNTIRKSWSHGISFIQSCFNRLLGNSTFDSGGYGIRFDANSHYNIVSGHSSVEDYSGFIQDLGVGNVHGSDNLVVP